MSDQNQPNGWVRCAVYGRWYFLNFFLCLIPIAVSYYFRDSRIPNSMHREIISSYLEYLVTLLAVTLYYKRRPTSLGPLIQIGSIIFGVLTFVTYMLYNLVPSVHLMINQYTYRVLIGTYLLCIAIALYFSWDALDEESLDHHQQMKLREAKEAGDNVKDMRARV